MWMLGSIPSAFQSHGQEAGSEMKQLGQELVPLGMSVLAGEICQQIQSESLGIGGRLEK